MWPKTDQQLWQEASAEAYRQSEPYRDPPVGLCAICKTPVRNEDQPIEIAWIPVGEAAETTGFIHGAWDCTDEPRCEELDRGTASGLEYSRQCVLPTTHKGDCFWGEPI